MYTTTFNKFFSILLLVIHLNLIHSYTVTEDQVTFYLRTKNNNTEAQITNENFSNLDAKKEFIFIIHGWTSTHYSEWIQNLTKAYLEKYDYNVIQVDWKVPAAQSEYVSAANTKQVGYFVGKFISKLIEELSVGPQNVSIIGHSFGGQITGFAGKEVQKASNAKVGKIIATDPARKPFESSLITEKLTKTDATTVAVIHTDAGNIGYTNPTGTIDFYPNGGVDPQPGCESSSTTHSCSHNIVNQFLIEAIENPNGFLSIKCDSYEDYLNGKCDSNVEVPLGGNIDDLQGVFYFQTNPQPPYSKN